MRGTSYTIGLVFLGLFLTPMATAQTADQLFQSALLHEKTALKSFPPDINMLVQGLHEVQQGVQLDNQASQKSAYWSQVSAELGRFGTRLSEDGQSVKTPFGTYPANADITTAVNNLSPQDILSVVTSGLGKSLVGSAQAGSDRSTAGDAVSANGDAQMSSGAQSSEAPAKVQRQIAETEDSDVENSEISLAEREQQLADYRQKLLSQIGKGLIGDSRSSIFAIVHAAYQAKRAHHAFMGSANLD